MAEDTLSKIIRFKMLPFKKCVTENLKIHGYEKIKSESDSLSIYGSDKIGIENLMKQNEAWKFSLSDEIEITPAQIIWAVRNEMARTVEDVLARRTRILFINAKAAYNLAPKVAEIMMKELAQDEKWKAKEIDSFLELASGYLLDHSKLKSPHILKPDKTKETH